MLAVLPQGDMAKSAATCVTLSWLSQSGSLEHKVFIFFFFLNEVQSGALSLGHDGMLAAFLELLFCLTCVEAAVTLRMNKHTCGKAFHTLKPFQMAMSCWVGCLYAAPPLD